MSTTTLFPGVYSTITDTSFGVNNLPGAYGFTCGLAEKGPDNVPIALYGTSDFIDFFGYPNWEKYGQAGYVAMNYLRIQGGFYFERILPEKAKYAVVKLELDTENHHVVLPNVISAHSNVADIEDWSDDPELNNRLNAIVFYPVGRGDYGNNYKLKITESTYLTDIEEVETGVDPNGNPVYTNFYRARTFNLDIYETRDGDDHLIYSRIVSFQRDAVDLTGDSIFIEDVLNYSDIIRCKVNSNIGFIKGVESSVVDGETIYAETADLWDWSLPLQGLKIEFMGGDDGWDYPNPRPTDNDVKSELIKAFTGTNIDPARGELNSEISDKDCLFFSVVFDAGFPLEVKNAILSLCQSRGNNTMGFLDCEDHKSFREIGGVLGSRKDPSKMGQFNNYLVALFDPYSRVYDEYTGRDFWASPIYHIAKLFALTERDYAVWYPFAGPNRGVVTGIKELRYKLVGNAKDKFKQNQINPIMELQNKGETLGYVLMGNWTSQKRASSLQDIHVVLTLQHIVRELEYNLIYFVFELNDAFTWELMRSQVNSILGEIKTRRGLESYSTRVTASEEDRKQHKCNVDVTLKVTGAIEAILVNLNVQ